MDGIELYGCRENNLKNVDLIIPYSKLTVFTGVSGSGKSSIAFNTLFAEGKRRYIESLGVSESYFLSKVKKPDADLIVGVPPTISLEQNKYIRNPRSSVGTISQINPYLQLLFSTCGSYNCESCLDNNQKAIIIANKHFCPCCGRNVGSFSASMFSVNSPSGMCHACEGTGIILDFDETLIWPNQNLSISENGLKLGGPSRGTTKYQFFDSFLRQFGVTIETPIKDFPNELKVALLFGVKKTKKFKLGFPGIINEYQKIYKTTKSIKMHENIKKYMVKNVCDACNGTGLNESALKVLINNYNIVSLQSLSLNEFSKELRILSFNDYRDKVAPNIIDKITNTLDILIDLGLGYLTLNRKIVTLSGGEMQRIRLAAQISSQISGVVYILDEPSIGMHQRDIQKLIKTIKKLNRIGNRNTIVLVEHDRDLINESDYIFDIGPGAGNLGGEIIASGSPQEIKLNENSITGKYLSGKSKISTPNYSNKFEFCNYIEIIGANANNLKDISLKIPINVLVGITGVSGSGKTSLICDSFHDVVIRKQYGNTNNITKQINGLNLVNRIVFTDQSPIGKSSRSAPVTYCGAYPLIRDLFAKTQSAQKLRYDQSYFSFNSKKGCCKECGGKGYLDFDMTFMEGLKLPCDFCLNKRFIREVLEIKYEGKNIDDILNMTVDEAVAFFNNEEGLVRKLNPIIDVGLGYLKLGQQTSTLSGGEAQRLKLAKELSKKRIDNTMFIFDEPTTGLHFQDISKLLDVFKKLLNKGNSIVLIEHNIDVIVACDYVIDLGPDGGEKGGEIVGAGTPLEISRFETHTGRALSDHFNRLKCL